MIHPKAPPLSPPLDEPRMECQLCGPFYHQVEIRFDSGSVEPTTGETITGATSADTGVVVATVLESGTYAGGDAAGTISLSGATGVGAASSTGNVYNYGSWGTDDEALNGSTGGNDMMTLNDEGIRKSYWHLWPRNQLLKREGKWYCHEHYHFKFGKDDLEKARINVREREGDV